MRFSGARRATMAITQLGPYKIGRKLGRGGMGTVYEGWDEQARTRAAVKVLSAALADQEGFRDRFVTEIETLKKLRHPNIVRLFGYGDQDGHLFYAMELVEGTSLEDELQNRRRFDWRETAQIGIQVCRALKHAHDRGVVHRDIKPANLLLTAEGDVKLSDFGIAKLFGISALTLDGGVVGTAEYMSPEQADGRPVTHRCDLYSLGGLLYALLASRPPFRAKTLPELLQLQRYAEPEPVRRYAPDTPAEMELILAQLLAKEPESRIASATLLSRRLEAMLHALSVDRSDHDEGDLGPTVVDPAPPRDGQSALHAPTMAADNESHANSAHSSSLDFDTTAVDDVGGRPPQGSQAERPADKPWSNAGAAAEDAANSPAPDSRGGRFTLVGDEPPIERRVDEETHYGARLRQIALLAVALGGVGALGWYLFQPPNADELYAKIESRVELKQPDALLAAVDDINRFLARFPSDPRGGRLRMHLAEVELLRLERRAERDARQYVTARRRNPVEQAYLEALRLAPYEPERAVVTLRAAIDLFGHGAQPAPEARAATPKLSKEDQQWLTLARRKSRQLDADLAAHSAEQLTRIHSLLDRADQIRATQPNHANSIYQSVIVLYSGKPWAHEAVNRAESGIRQLARPNATGEGGNHPNP